RHARDRPAAQLLGEFVKLVDAQHAKVSGSAVGRETLCSAADGRAGWERCRGHRLLDMSRRSTDRGGIPLLRYSGGGLGWGFARPRDRSKRDGRLLRTPTPALLRSTGGGRKT